MARRVLTFADRAQIAIGVKAGLSDAVIGELIGRHRTVIWRERARNSTLTRGYRPVSADVTAERRRARPQTRAVDADPVLRAGGQGPVAVADAASDRGQFASGSRDPSVGLMPDSLPADGATVSHEAIYRWIYALPKGELAREAIMLRSKRRARKRRRPLGERSGGRIVGMTSIDARPADTAERKVPGHWEDDLIIGANGASAAATLVERTSRFTIILGLAEGKSSDALADVLIDAVNACPTSCAAP